MKDVSFVIVGDPNWAPKYSMQIKNLVQERSLKDYFLFTGRVPLQEKLEFYSISDIFVLPSISEAFGMVIIEAMASGLPVIGSNAGGIPEIIKHGENGLLFKVGDYQSLAEKILILLNDEKMCKEMGKKSRRIAVQNFSYERMANEYIKVYKEVLR
jgi:glycosyltransferase involved in cell wall biosynthesis